jgi:hypothetical protein
MFACIFDAISSQVHVASYARESDSVVVKTWVHLKHWLGSHFFYFGERIEPNEASAFDGCLKVGETMLSYHSSSEHEVLAHTWHVLVVSTQSFFGTY